MMNLKKHSYLQWIFILLMLLGSSAWARDNQDNDRSSDTTITAKVNMQLAATRGIPSRDITVSTYQGVVQLAGFVSNQRQKRQAERVARSVKDVRDVSNNLIVQPAPRGSVADKTKQYAADTATTTRVKTALAADARVKSSQITVMTSYGVTQLSGFVTDAQTARAAADLTGNVEGVKKVVNSLILVNEDPRFSKTRQ